MILSKQLDIKIVIFTLSVTWIIGLAIIWDLYRLNEDFNNLYSLLRIARLDAFYKNTTIIVRFNNNMVTVTDQKKSTSMTTTIPMIAKVSYDTIMGNDMIVYDSLGTTSAYNKKIHGGEIMIKSMLGFKRYLHVNCNGMVLEERYPAN